MDMPVEVKLCVSRCLECLLSAITGGKQRDYKIKTRTKTHVSIFIATINKILNSTWSHSKKKKL